MDEKFVEKKQTISGLSYAIKFYESLPEADCCIIDTVIPNWMPLNDSLQFYAKISVMPGFRMFK